MIRLEMIRLEMVRPRPSPSPSLPSLVVKKALKHPLEMLASDAGAGVLDCQHDLARFGGVGCPGANPDVGAAAGRRSPAVRYRAD